MPKPARKKQKRDNQKRTKGLPKKTLEQPSAVEVVGPRDYFLLVGLLLAISIFVFRGFLLFQKTYLFKDIGSDSVNAFYPHFVLMVDYLRSVGMPAWSFNQGMGQNVFAPGALALGFGDPFLFLFYIFGRNRIGFAMAYAEVLKILLGGSFFFLYLRTLGLTRFACVLGGLLFGFSGYMILGGQWYQFSYDAMCGALLLFAFEKLYKDRVWYFFPIPIALFAAYQPFYLYLYGLLIFVYAPVRFLERESWNTRKYARLMIEIVICSLLGLGLSGLFLFENVQALLLSPRVTGEVTYFQKLASQSIFSFADPLEYASIVLRLFSNDLMGTGSNFKGWNNYLESPILYCGGLTLMFVPQFFAFLDRRKKKIFFGLAGLLVLTLIFPYARYLVWGFSGNYYRTFSFFIALALLFFGLRGLSFVDQSRKVNRPLFIVTIVVLLALVLGASYGADGVNVRLLIFIVSALLLYTAITAALLVGEHKRFWRPATIALVCVELAYLSGITINNRPVVTAAELSQRVGYNDYTVDAIHYLDSTDKEFYRVQKEYSSGPAIHSSLNDSKIQQYYGSSSYATFNQKNYIQFLHGVDVVKSGDEFATRWAKGLSRPMLRVLGSVKYVLTKSADNNLQVNGYQPLTSFNDVRVYQNRYFLPLGFAFDSFVTASDFSRLTTAQKDRVILKALVIDDAQQAQFNGFQRLQTGNLSDDYPPAEFLNDFTARKTAVFSMIEHEQNKIRGTIKLEKTQLLFFSIPFDPGWSAIVDGHPAQLEKVDFGLTGILLGSGEHSVELRFRPKFLTLGMIVTATAGFVYAGLLLFPLLSRRRTLHSHSQAPAITVG